MSQIFSWEGLHSDTLLQSREANNPSTEGTGSWLGCNGPPEHLNKVPVEPPTGIFSVKELTWIDGALAHMAGSVDDADVARLWVQALALAHNIYPDMFKTKQFIQFTDHSLQFVVSQYKVNQPQIISYSGAVWMRWGWNW